MQKPVEHACAMAAPASGFDKLARAYRWMEYLTFGRALSRSREHFLPQLQNARSALVLGDGDGRFTAALLRGSPSLHVDAVDVSAPMLQQLLRRVKTAGAGSRVRAHHADVTRSLPPVQCDLVCTHFFLDCLTAAEVEALVMHLGTRMPQGLWVISEFAIPKGVARWPATLVVRLLYFAFGLLAGLRTRTLPDYPAALGRHGFTRLALHTRLFGLLRSELWVRRKDCLDSHVLPAASNSPNID